ncbi:MAG: response regulator [Holophaga sp.]|nr:response regulator [Holophaga sp.]
MPRILVTDDNAAIRTLLTEILEGNGHEVETASDGVGALKCRQNQTFDVLITDIFMPEKDGIELIMEVKTRFPDLKVIAISGGGPGVGMDLLNPARRLGAKRILRKPVSRADLLQAVNEVLEDSNPEGLSHP